MPDGSSAQLVPSPLASASSSAVNVEPSRRRSSSSTKFTRRLASRVSASRRRRAPCSHWKTAVWSGYATPVQVSSAMQVLDHEGALALLDHPELARPQLQRLRRLQRLEARLQVRVGR